MSEQVYEFSISTDFGGNIKTSQLLTEIQESAISNNIIRIDTDDDTVYIIFDAELSSGDEIILNNLVSAHVPEINLNSYVKVQIFTTQPSNDTYTDIGSFRYNPNIGTLKGFGFIAKCDKRINGYDFRVVNLSNSAVLCESTGYDNNEIATFNIFEVDNIPTDESILQAQIRSYGSSKRKNDVVSIYEIIMYY